MFELIITYTDNYGCATNEVLTKISDDYEELSNIAKSYNTMDSNGTYDYTINALEVENNG